MNEYSSLIIGAVFCLIVFSGTVIYIRRKKAAHR
jgi:hypothetical protein